MTPRLGLVRYAPTSDRLYEYEDDADRWASAVSDRQLQPLIQVVDTSWSTEVPASAPPPTTGG